MQHYLPCMASDLVGRERDVAQVAELLAGARLVTVTGPAGVGKTRLAVEVAAAAADRFCDGVCLVELAGARGPEEAAGAVASALSVDAQSGPSSVDTLVAALRHRRVLAVLDNCEHLVHDVAVLAERLLRACPGLSVLATSQEALTIAGERVWHLGPLALPAPEAVDDPDELAGYAAVRLFVARATARRADFVLTRQTAPAVAEICRRLDGMPLAIELAAARVALLGPDEIARRLNDRFGVLTGGARTVARHQSLQAALDWSHDLLSEPEQTLFRRLGVFAGGWTLEAAEQGVAGGEVARDEVFDLLAGLVARSLVVAETGARSRYRLLDTTGAYARDRLAEAGEAGELDARHAAWCVALAERADIELAGGDQRTWLDRLDAERDNLHAALSSATGGDDADQALRLAGALVLYWSMRGRFREGLGWLERALATGGGTPARRGVALWGAGLLARALGDHATARDRAADSLDLARGLGDTRLAARALSVLGAVGVSACDGSTMTMEMLEESVALAREVDDGWCEVASLVAMGFGHLVQGDPPAARRSFQGCLAVAQRQGTDAGEGHRVHALIGLGRTALASGDHRTAEGLLTEAADLARTRGFLAPAANALRFLGEAACTRGDYDTARRALQESLDLSRGMGATVPTSLALSALGRLALTEGDTTAAGQVLEEARALGVSEGPGTGAACALTGLGAVERAVGDAPEARTRLRQALDTAHQAGDHEAAARALHELGRTASDDDDNPRAASLLHAALTLYRELGDEPSIAGCLEALARIDAEEGRLAAAARLLGAAQALRDSGGYARAPLDQPDYDSDVALVRRALGAEQFDGAWAEGASVSVEEAASYAVRGRGPRGSAHKPAQGWDSLSTREREAVLHAAEGLTNSQIGQRMLISPRTVQTHLAHAYAKLGVASRQQLADVSSSRRAT